MDSLYNYKILLMGLIGVGAADLDNDGDMYVLSASEENNTFAFPPFSYFFNFIIK